MARTTKISSGTIARAQRGEREAVAELVGAYLPRVYGLALRMTRSRDLAEEASQETFVRVLKNLSRLKEARKLDSTR